MMSQLKAKLRVQALIRRAEVQGAFAAIVYAGDGDAGVVFVKVRSDAGAALYVPGRDMAGKVVYRFGPPDTDAAIDARVARERDMDPDLWLIEVDDRQGRPFLTEPIEPQ